MRFSLATVVSALAAVVTAHTQPDYSKAPSGNAILKPGLQEAVPAGKPYDIKWQPTTEGPVSLVLLRGPSTNVQPLVTIAEQIPNDGSFTWTPSTELEPDVTHYGLMLVVQGTGQYQYSTQFAPNCFRLHRYSGRPLAAYYNSCCRAYPTVVETVTTTDCPETTPAAHSTIPVSVNTSSPTLAPSSSAPVQPTTMQTSSSRAVSSSAAPSAGPSSSGPSGPIFTGAASRNGLSIGAVAAGAVAVLAF
ncbi:Extracellular serine-threonine rich protein [Aspergillus sclerotialis]|uniref:Extracellular serine-threonine rich protein n=1 Tax=Aspergillus sclerotialis TaxID=2070753 RepID=A0A3A3A4N4_9EURO|nr:Extracellular serine-threonine rich protein [Aspergillus sclerotialis]